MRLYTVVTRLLDLNHPESAVINLDELSLPDRNIITIEFPQQSLSYTKNGKPAPLIKTYNIGGTVEGTPTAVFKQLYEVYISPLMENDNLLLKRVENNHTILFGRNIILMDNIPVFVAMHLWDNESERWVTKTILGVYGLSESSPSMKFVLTKLMRFVVVDNSTTIICDTSKWADNSEVKVIQQTDIKSKVCSTLLEHIDAIYE